MGGMGGGRRGGGCQRGGNPGFTFRFGWFNSSLYFQNYDYIHAIVKINKLI